MISYLNCRWCSVPFALRVVAAGVAAILYTGCLNSSGTGGATKLSKGDLATPRFTEVAQAAGLRYEWKVPGSRPFTILQTFGNGCAFLDFNCDGNLDILLVGQPCGLFQGDGRGKFVDVSIEAGVRKLSGNLLGCAVGDVNRDGYPDVFLSGKNCAYLLHNEGGSRFIEVTQASGITSLPWGTSASFAETISGSGNLDLFAGNYVSFGPKTEPQLCLEGGIRTSCGPRYYDRLRGVFYRGGGNGRFKDASSEMVVAKTGGRVLGVVFADFDNSGKQSLSLANDGEPGDLLKNLGTGKWKNIREQSGTSYDRDGNLHAGMGTDVGDFDGDGMLDLLVATFQGEVKCLYRNEGDNTFSDAAYRTGLALVARERLTFGSCFFDMDNDGRLDIVLANGHVQDNIDKMRPEITYRQATQFLQNEQGVQDAFPRYVDVSAQCSTEAQKPIVGRGLATGDYDNDGRQDLLVVDSEGAPLLLHNEQKAGNWVGVRLEGVQSNKDGYGALLTATVGGRRLVRHCHADGSYLSSSDPRVHFGLGQAARIDMLTIRWPSGKTDTLTNVPAGGYLTVREGSSTAKSAPRALAAK